MNRWTGILLLTAATTHLSLQGQICTGTVLDPSGAAIAGAQIHLQNTETTTNQRGAFTLPCAAENQITVQAEGFADAQLTAHAGANLTVRLRIAEVHTVVEVGKDSGASVDIDHGAGTHTLTAEDLQGMADDPDDFKRQLQILAASSGGAPGQAILTVDGFQNSSTLPPKSSIASIRVNPDMFSSEYDRPPYQGGRVEIFTKPGRDSLHGALFFTDSDSALNATDPFALTGTPAGKRRYGFELGGPIRKQKSDFFLALERRDIHEFNVVDAFVPAPLHQNIPAPKRLWIGSVRSDLQLNLKNTLALTYSANVNDSDNVGSGGLVLAEAGYNSTISEQDLRLTDVFTISPVLLNEAHIGFTWKNTTDVPLSTEPSLQVAGAFTGGGATAGHLQDRERDLEVDDDLLWSHRNHSVKLGVQSIGVLEHDYDPDTFNGAYIYGGGLDQYQLGEPTTYNLTQGQPLVPFQQWRVAIYAQDQWKLKPNLSIALGLRYALQTAPASYRNLVPRVGIAWSPDRKQQWVIHARGGLFSSAVMPDVTTEAYRLNGQRQTQTLFYAPSTPQAGAIVTTRQFAPGLGQTWSFQSQLGVEHELPQHWHAQANLYDAQAWGVLRSRNINAPLVNDSTVDPWLAPRPLALYRNIFQFEQSGHLHGQVVFVGVDQHSYKRFSIFVGYLYFNLRTDADTAFFFPQNSYSDRGETARASWESTHRLFAIGQLNLPQKVSLTSQFDASSGDPYNVITGTDNNGDGVFNDRPPVLPRNTGTMPALIHLDSNLSRTFELRSHGLAADKHQTITLNARSANLLNHTNVTNVGNVVGSPTFTQSLAAEPARRIEFGIRYTF